MVPTKNDPISREFRKYIETTYSLVPKDELERIIENLVSIMEIGQEARQPLKVTLEQVAKAVSRLFGFSEVAIGLKDRKGDIWKYEVLYGFAKETEATVSKVRYNRADMFSPETFPNVKTGRLSELNPVEGMPLIETDKYGRPFKWGLPRRSMDEFHAGDFLDFWMFDNKKEIIGWIEVSAPRSGKQPPRIDVRWIELFASACAYIVRLRWLEEDMLRR